MQVSKSHLFRFISWMYLFMNEQPLIRVGGRCSQGIIPKVPNKNDGEKFWALRSPTQRKCSMENGIPPSQGTSALGRGSQGHSHTQDLEARVAHKHDWQKRKLLGNEMGGREPHSRLWGPREGCLGVGISTAPKQCPQREECSGHCSHTVGGTTSPLGSTLCLARVISMIPFMPKMQWPLLPSAVNG